MNYSLLIQDRSSARAFEEKKVPEHVIADLLAYHDKECARLIPSIRTELLAFGTDAKQKLEKAAGYNEFLIGAPCYLVLLSEEHQYAGINAGFVMEDIVLKIEEAGLKSCWLTFTDEEKIRKSLTIESGKKAVAVIALGYPQRARKRIRVNIFSMSNVGIEEKKHYFDPKKKISEMVWLDTYGNNKGVDDRIGFYDDLLWESFAAAANSPSYMNRQPYSFLIKDWNVYLISENDSVTGPIDKDLDLGIVMLHFIGVAQSYVSSTSWKMAGEEQIELPEGACVIASCRV